MNRGGRAISMLTIVAALYGAGLRPAVARGPLVLGIPGLSATTIRVGGVQRLDDGGALVAATLSPRRPNSPSHLALVRMLSDGSLDLAYGTLGISTPPVGDARATALTVNPSTAEAWIGLAHGRSDRGEILAVDGQGRVVTVFGQRGRVELHAGVPAAIAWRPGQLFLAMGRSSCRGCTVALASAATGRIGPTRRLAPNELVGNSSSCSARSISGVLFTPTGNVLLGVNAAGHGCAAGLAQARPAQLIAAGTAVSVAAPLGSAVGTDVLGALGAQTCVGGSGPRGIEFGSLDRHNTARPAFRGPAGGLVSMVALGHGACAVLIGAHSGGVVLQATSRGRVSRDTIPPTIEPLGMFRCHEHLLVLGSHRRGGNADTVLVVVPVRRGPYASATATRMARTTTSGSGCR